MIEAPTMARHGSSYALFFSANHYGWEPDQNISVYAIGYARCQGPLGPCTDAPENPILHSFNTHEAGCLSGPGHQAVFQVGARYFLSFHAWAATADCHRAEEPRRYLYIAPLGWRDDGTPVIGASLRRRQYARLYKAPAEGRVGRGGSAPADQLRAPDTPSPNPPPRGGGL